MANQRVTPNLTRRPPSEDFNDEVPRRSFVERYLPFPVERTRRDFREAPARQRARLRRPFLNNIRPLPAPDRGIVDADCCPVPITGHRHRRSVGTAIDDPHVLYSATLKHPTEVDLAVAFVAGTVGRVGE